MNRQNGGYPYQQAQVVTSPYGQNSIYAYRQPQAVPNTSGQHRGYPYQHQHTVRTPNRRNDIHVYQSSGPGIQEQLVVIPRGGRSQTRATDSRELRSERQS